MSYQTILAGVLMMRALTPAVPAEILRVDVNSMPRIVFTGDSQTCGRVGALDYPQMLSWELPLRVFNTGVGGTSITHLLQEKTGGTATVKQGETVVHGEKVGWHAGSYPGQKLRLGKQEYVIDRAEVIDYNQARSNLHLTEPAREGFSGTDFAVEAGWRVRIAEIRPQYAVFMYSVNDPGWTSEQFKGYLAEITQRCRQSGIEPIFLSGFPLMEATSGGSHPGNNERVLARPQDMLEFATAEKACFGDVFRTLMLLDQQRTSVWVDTVHPTTDGSLPAIQAMRDILRRLGAGRNTWLKAYRSPGADLPVMPSTELAPITTSQPDYDVNNKPDDNAFSLEAIRARDEYGLLAEADGQYLRSETPLVLAFGSAEPLTGVKTAVVEIVTEGPAEVLWLNLQAGKWEKLADCNGKLRADLPAQALLRATFWPLYLAVRGEKLGVDYAALELNGSFPRGMTAPGPPHEAILWPDPSAYKWSAEGNLFPNGDLQKAKAGVPVGWQKQGAALYLPSGVVAKGNGDFAGERRCEQFRAAGQDFTATVRPLDMLQIAQGLESATGNFLIEKVVSEEHLDLRRAAKAAAEGLDFVITRSSGLNAVPGSSVIEAGPAGSWQATIKAPAGASDLSFFYRVYDPAGMTATSRPGREARGQIEDRTRNMIFVIEPRECSYVWQRHTETLILQKAGKLVLQLRAAGATPVQYTGFSLVKR